MRFANAEKMMSASVLGSNMSGCSQLLHLPYCGTLHHQHLCLIAYLEILPDKNETAAQLCLGGLNLVSLHCKALELGLSELVELADKLSLPVIQHLVELCNGVMHISFNGCLLVRYLIMTCVQLCQCIFNGHQLLLYLLQ